MNGKLTSTVVFVLFSLTVVGSVRADYVIDDFESYADPNAPLISSVWSERNSNAQITLITDDSNDFHQVMNYAYQCGTGPYWTEAYTVFDANEDWSMYDTFSMWVKGKTTSQSLEDMYVAIYKAKVADPNNHDDLEILGAARFYYVTQKPDWTYWRADIDYNFASLSNVRAIGIGMTPVTYGSGVIQIDELAVDYTELGGVIDNFESYVDANDFWEEVYTDGDNITVDIVDDANVFIGNQCLKVNVDHSSSPFNAKLAYAGSSVRALNPNWLEGGYNPLTVHFKVTDADGYIQITLVDSYGANVAWYRYNNGAPIPVGDWIRWDINLLEPYGTKTGIGPNFLDNIKRVDVWFKQLYYGLSEYYLDDIYVNDCILDSNLSLGDCIIDFQDFAILASHWQETGCAKPDYCEGADFLIDGERDGVVNILDAAVMVSEWLDCGEMLYGDDCL